MSSKWCTWCGCYFIVGSLGVVGAVEMVWLVRFREIGFKNGTLLGPFCLKRFSLFWIDAGTLLSLTTEPLLLFTLKIKKEFSMKFTLHWCLKFAVEMVRLVRLRVKFEGFEQFLAMSVYIELLKRKLRWIANKHLFFIKI